MEYSLQVKDLSKTFNEFTLKNVSFDLPKGSIMGFVGENGAGKTTTIKLILNMLKKENGTVYIFGMDNINDEAKIKNEVGVVLADSFFPENLNPKQIANVMQNLYPDFNRKKFDEYLKKFKLPANKCFKDFSSGMKMKCKLAVVLSHDPKLLILDEPTSGLDPIVRSEILDIFLEYIQDEEKSIFLSSHITGDLEKIADYITFIHDGKIIFSQAKDELIDNYGIIKCGKEDYTNIDKGDIIGRRSNQFGYELLVKNRTNIKSKYSGAVIDNASVDDIMLFYVKGEKA